MVLLVVLGVVLLVLAAGYLTWVAGRLERAWLRVEAARASLDAQLVRRATAAADLARDRGPPAGEPVSGAPEALSSAAAQALSLAAVPSPEGDVPIVSLPASAPGEWAAAQSGLTRALRTVPKDDWGDRLAAAVEKTRMARQFHNETVLSTRALRRRRVVRFFLLGRNHPLPTFAEFDDEP